LSSKIKDIFPNVKIEYDQQTNFKNLWFENYFRKI
jgi:hypothetical protein